MAKPLTDEIPDGYSPLRRRAVLRDGDLFFSLLTDKWEPAGRIGKPGFVDVLYIRKRKTK